MSDYPGSLDSFTDPSPGQPLNTPSQSNLFIALNSAVVAIQEALGTDPQGIADSVKTRLNLGLGLRQIITFETSGVFTKADYLWLRLVRARVQAGGGAGGGPVATGASGVSAGTGGSAGSYAETVVLASALSASETVTVGAAGAGSAGATGGAGGTSSFGAHAIAAGGAGGNIGTTTVAGRLDFQSAPVASVATVGQILAGGSAGGHAIISRAGGLERGMGGVGGSSMLGGGGRGLLGGSNPGGLATGFGAGGGGGGNGNSGSAQAGGNGAPGIIILELYG